MSNFISVFDELSQLYESANRKVVSKTTDQLCSIVTDDDTASTSQMFTGTREECEDWLASHPDPSGKNRFKIRDCADVCVLENLNESDAEGIYKLSPIGGFYHVEFRDRALYQLVWRKKLIIAELDHGVLRVGSSWGQHILDGYGADCLAAIRDFLFTYSEVLINHVHSLYGSVGTEEIGAFISDGLKSGVVERVANEEVFVENLREDVEEETEAEEVEAEEVEAEEAPDEVEEEPEVKTLILECAECGCLVRKEETEVNIDEETDLANVDEACTQCEKTAGYKVVGELVPYDAAEPVEESVNTEEDDELSDPAFSNALMESADDVEEGLFDFGKKKREAERKRREEEEAARKAEQEKSKSKWPTAADYDAYEREQREQRRIDAEMAKYKAMGKDWNKRADSSSPSNTPYAGVNYSGGDYF